MAFLCRVLLALAVATAAGHGVNVDRDTPSNPSHAAHHGSASTFASKAARAFLLQGGTQGDAVKEWLKHLVISIPDTSFDVPLDAHNSVNITVTNLTCQNLTLGEIISSFAPPAALNVSVGGLAISCYTSSVGVRLNSLEPLLGVEAGITLDDTSLAYGVVLHQDAHGIPTSASCTEASLVPHVPDGGVYIHFAKSWKILNAFQKTIESALQKTLVSQVGGFVETEFKTLTDVNLTAALQQLAAKVEPNMHPGEFPIPPPPPPDALNLLDAWPMTLVDFAINHILGGNGTANVNHVIKVLTNGTGTLALHNLTNASFTAPLPGLATITFGVYDFTLGGLDTWTELELVQVNGPTSAVSHTAMDSLVVNITAYVNISTPSGPLVSTPLYEEFAFAMNLSNMSLMALTNIAFNRSAVKSHGMHALDASFGCTLRELMSFNTSYLHMDVNEETLSLSPAGGDIEADIDGLINRVIELVLSGYHAGIPAVLTTLIDEPLMTAVDAAVLKARDSANCTPGPPIQHVDVDQNHKDRIMGIAISASWFFLVTVALICALCYTVHPEGVQTTECVDFCSTARSDSPDDDVSLLNPHFNGTLNGGDRLYPSLSDEFEVNGDPIGDSDARTVPMLLDGRMSLLVRVGIPALVLLNIFAFLISNYTTGAQLFIGVTIDGELMQSPPLFSFSLGNTIKDLYNSHCYVLCVIVVLFTGFWPYAKLLILTIVWVMPPSLISPVSALKLTIFTDAVGKWSLLDSFLMIMFMVAFRLHLVGTVAGSNEFQKDVPIAIDVVVAPAWGFYSYLASTCFSLILNHGVVHYLRTIDEPDDKVPPSNKAVALCSFNFFHDGRTLYFKKRGRVVVSVLLGGALLLFAAGVYVKSFTFEFLGIAGWALDPTLNGKNIRPYSVISLWQQLETSAMFISAAGLEYLRLAYLMFTVVLPATQLIILQILWLVPLREKTQWRALVAAEILNAWQAIDVFMLAIIASLAEIRQFCAFMVDANAAFLNPYIKKYFDKPLHGDDTAFDVITTLTDGCWLLVSSAIVQFLVGCAVLALCNTALAQQSAVRNGRKVDSSSKSLTFFVKFLPSLLREKSDGMIDNDSALLNEVRA
mmetsp:Transcript_14758/g.43678  ORF Transcript_14758/g.43678 Transcript_14758/m.43678 type:complete len:1102 (+) Transcript_14758:182-3487(+)